MSSLNKVLLIGRVGKDPEVKEFQSGRMAKFSVATNEKTKDGERAEWHNITTWGKTAELVEQYVTKGKLLFIEGKIQTRSYEKNGEKRYSTEIIANNVRFLGGRSDAQQKPPGDYNYGPPPLEEELPF